MKKLEKLESIGATFQPLIPYLHKLSVGTRSRPRIETTRLSSFERAHGDLTVDKKGEKRDSHKFESTITLAPMARSSFLPFRVGFRPFEGGSSGGGSFKTSNCKFRGVDIKSRLEAS